MQDNTTNPLANSFPDPIPGYMRFGSISTLSGETSVGKTAFTATMIHRFQTGRSICGHPTNRPTDIGMISGDRSWATAKHWLDAAGCDPIKYLCIRDERAFPWADLRDSRKVPELVRSLLRKLSLLKGGLLFIDPMPLFIPGRVNDYKDMAIGFGTLAQVIEPFELSTLGVFHQSKQHADQAKGYSRPQDRILGSCAQIGFSDTSMYLMPPQDLDTKYYGFGWVPHNAIPETFPFTRDRNGLFVPYQGLIDESANPSNDRPTQLLLLIPEDDGIETAELEELAITTFEISRRTFFRDLNVLKSREAIRWESGWLWRRKSS